MRIVRQRTACWDSSLHYLENYNWKMKREAKGKSPLPSCASRPSAIRGNIPISLRRARLAQHPRGKLPLPIPCSPRSSQRDTYTERGVLRQEFEIDISNPTHRHRARKEKNPTPSPPWAKICQRQPTRSSDTGDRVGFFLFKKTFKTYKHNINNLVNPFSFHHTILCYHTYYIAHAL